MVFACFRGCAPAVSGAGRRGGGGGGGERPRRHAPIRGSAAALAWVPERAVFRASRPRGLEGTAGGVGSRAAAQTSREQQLSGLVRPPFPDPPRALPVSQAPVASPPAQRYTSQGLSRSSRDPGGAPEGFGGRARRGRRAWWGVDVLRARARVFVDGFPVRLQVDIYVGFGAVLYLGLSLSNGMGVSREEAGAKAVSRARGERGGKGGGRVCCSSRPSLTQNH
jgi:hypothetical protein